MLDVPALLRRHGATALLVEHFQWDALHLSAPLHEVADCTKTVIVLDGIPGAGKSTTREWLAPAVGAAFLSMARFAEARDVSSDERQHHQFTTRRPHPADVAFLEAIATCSERYILVEKFPRSPVEAAALLECAQRLTWRVEVLHLDLPGDAVELSRARQIARGPRRGRMPEPEHARRRALAYVARTTSARRLLREHNVPIYRIDMTRPKADVRATIRRSLGLDYTALRWHLPTLEVLETVSGALGIDAFLAGGSVYRPFWNDRFGPMQVPTDADVAVSREWEVAPLLEALTRVAPHEHWSVLCPSSRIQDRFGLQTQSVAEAKALSTFLHRTGLVRLQRGEIELFLAPGAEAALWNGVLQINPVLLDRLNAEQRAVLIARDTDRLPPVIGRYPGLGVDAATAQLLRIPTTHPRVISSGFEVLKSRALVETRPARVPHCRRRLTPPELAVAHEILAFHRQSVRRSDAPLRPQKSSHPLAPLSLVSLARDADDQTFATWLLDQQRHNPSGGRDPDLEALLRLDLAPRPHSSLGPMHQGWALERHLVESTLQLETDALVARLGAPDLRLCMRIAMLYHDVGKLLGPRPARHPQISARLFAKHRPRSFPVTLVPLTQWMIRVHDVFGAFTRGLTDKVGHAAGDYDVDPAEPSSYYGAIDAQAARARIRSGERPFTEALAIAKALWRADVGAIAALRWLQPVAEMVERLLLLPVATAFAGVERRASAHC